MWSISQKMLSVVIHGEMCWHTQTENHLDGGIIYDQFNCEEFIIVSCLKKVRLSKGMSLQKGLSVVNWQKKKIDSDSITGNKK